MIQLAENRFQMGWFNHQLVWCCVFEDFGCQEIYIDPRCFLKILFGQAYIGHPVFREKYQKMDPFQKGSVETVEATSRPQQ